MGKRKRRRNPLGRAATAAEADGLREPGRFSARRKTETILRMLRGEPLDSLVAWTEMDRAAFLSRRAPYLLYR